MPSPRGAKSARIISQIVAFLIKLSYHLPEKYAILCRDINPDRKLFELFNAIQEVTPMAPHASDDYSPP